MFTHLGQLFGSGVQELEGVDLDDDGQVRHLLGGQALPDHLVHEQDAGLGVVDQIVDIAGFELMQDRDGHGTIGDGGQETDAPVGLVTGADSHLVSFLETALFKGDVQFGDSAGHVTIGQCHALVVGKGRTVPVADHAFLKRFINRLEFHVF